MVESVPSTVSAKTADRPFNMLFLWAVAADRGRSHWGRRLSPYGLMDPESEAMSALMERYAAGDDSVFTHLYRLMAPRLYRFCLRLTTRASEADDCFQETFLRVHGARATFTAGANALHWAFAIARSVYLTKLRYWKRRPEALGAETDLSCDVEIHPGDAATPEAQLVAEHLLGTLVSELRKMSEKNRAAYVLMKEEGLSAKQAAAVLGTREDVVRQRAHRAYEQLKSALGAAGWEGT